MKKLNSFSELEKSTESINNSEPRKMDFLTSAKYVDRFYDIFIGKRKEIASENYFKFYEADSPFGPGKIIISHLGGWYDESSRDMGSMKDFLKKMFPIITDSEAMNGVWTEYYDYIYPEKKHLKTNDSKGQLEAILIGQSCLIYNFIQQRKSKVAP